MPRGMRLGSACGTWQPGLSGFGGRTATRLARGSLAPRWDEALASARAPEGLAWRGCWRRVTGAPRGQPRAARGGRTSEATTFEARTAARPRNRRGRLARSHESRRVIMQPGLRETVAHRACRACAARLPRAQRRAKRRSGRRRRTRAQRRRRLRPSTRLALLPAAISCGRRHVVGRGRRSGAPRCESGARSPLEVALSWHCIGIVLAHCLYCSDWDSECTPWVPYCARIGCR